MNALFGFSGFVGSMLRKHIIHAPLLYEKHCEIPACYSILGGKINFIYGIFEKPDAAQLDLI